MELSYRKGGAHLKSTGSKFALIPAYMPAQPMLQTARELTNHGFSVVIVNDGSPSSFDSVFRNAETFATVITLPENQGKGEALKEGLRFLRDNVVPPYIVVTVDADGQHRIDDVLRVYACAEKHPDDLVLGSRELQKDAPLKSKIGNSITNFLHRVTTGMRLTDTQTGLRAFSDKSIDRVIRSGGSRYEYEMFMLLNFSRAKNIREVPIEAVYIDNNSASHFQPFKDSAKIYKVFFRYAFVRNEDKFNRKK